MEWIHISHSFLSAQVLLAIELRVTGERSKRYLIQKVLLHACFLVGTNTRTSFPSFAC